MRIETMKRYIPRSIKNWIKSYPFVENLLDRILNGKRQITVFNEIKGMLSADEREHLFLIAKSLKNNSTIVEIGCFAGLSTYFLGKGATISQSKIYSIDPFNHAVERQLKEGDSSWYLKKVKEKPSLHRVQNMLKEHSLDKIITLVEGFGQEVAQTWNYGKIDFLWIDGNHLEAYNDFKAWERHLSKNAMIAFHDSFGPLSIPEVAKDVERIILEKNEINVSRYKSITTIILNSDTSTSAGYNLAVSGI